MKKKDKDDIRMGSIEISIQKNERKKKKEREVKKIAGIECSKSKINRNIDICRIL